MTPLLGPHSGLREGPAGGWPSATLPFGAREEVRGSQAWSTAEQPTELPVWSQLLQAEPKGGNLYS